MTAPPGRLSHGGAPPPAAQSVARNSLWNLIGAGLPMLVALLSIPYVIRGLGPERFGVLALAWALLGYFGAMDLGIGRAATKFLAEAIGQDRPGDVPALAWSAVQSQLALGLVGAGLLAGLSRILVVQALNLPPALVPESLASFYLLAAAVPFVLVAGSLRGILEAAHRFDLVNLVRAPFSAANNLLPAVGVFLGWGLPGVIALLVAARIVAMLVSVALCLRVFPSLRAVQPVRASALRTLLGYGGWIAVSSVVSPVLVYLDRFVIGSLVTMGAVAYYAAPSEMVSRLLIISTSLVASLFPTFSARAAQPSLGSVVPLAARSTKYILVLLGPLVVLTAAFAEDILRLWLGADAAAHGADPLALLAMGVLAIAVAQVPYTLLQAVGRPDLTAKFHLVELPIHAVVCWALVARWGITGAALATLLRALLDMSLLNLAARRVSGLTWGALGEARVPRTLTLLGAYALVSMGTAALPYSLPSRAALAAAVTALAILTAWRWVMDPQDRLRLTRLVRRPAPSVPAPGATAP